MTPRPPTRSRRGTFVPMLAVTAVGLLSFVALAVDLGMVTVARTQCQNAADSCALAAARALNARPGSSDGGYANALAASNAVAPQNSYVGNSFAAPGSAGLKIGLYDYNVTNAEFAPDFSNTGTNPPTNKTWSAARVSLSVSQPMFFAKIFGVSAMPNGANATAIHRPRDIALILDFSGSMRFGTTFNWGDGNGSANANGGMLSQDALYPQFGHYQRYTEYQTGNPNATQIVDDVTVRPNPLRSTVGYRAPGSGELLAPNNYTVANASGPAAVDGFVTAPGAAAGASPTFSYDPATNTLTGAASAFRSSGALTLATPTTTDQADTTFTQQIGTGYIGDKWPRKYGSTNEAASWDPTDPDGAAVNLAEYLGWCAKYTSGGGDTVKNLSQTFTRSWPTFRDATWERYGYDLDVKNYIAKRTALGWDPRWDWDRPGGDNPSLPLGVLTGGNYRHEPLVAGVTNPLNEPPASVRSKLTSNADTPIKLKDLPAGQQYRFNGFSTGPGFWGKTFFIWPPDPRQPRGEFGDSDYVAGDWRLRFFTPLENATTSVALTTYNLDTVTSTTRGNQRCNQRMFTSWTNNTNTIFKSDETGSTEAGSTAQNADRDTGHTLTVAPYYAYNSGNNASGYSTPTANVAQVNFRINYPAVLRWIRSGPQVFPPNLRAGRVCYYTSIPDDVNFAVTGTINTSSTYSLPAATDRVILDQVFWKTYIDYVLEQYSRGMKDLAGYEQIGWPEDATGGTGRVRPNIDTTAPSRFDVDGGGSIAADPAPYMDYRDNPSRPRLHFWFGPLSMMAFIANGVGPGWAGTTHEAQDWQLKAAISSGIDDIRYNHPNDYVGMTYFSSGTWNSGPVVNSGQNWNILKDALFYPRTLAVPSYNATTKLYTATSTVRSNVNSEFFPFSKNNRTMGYRGNGDIPNANGGTCPESGFAMAYNTLTTFRGGRRGAAKIVIFETDGVPNATCSYTTNNNGYESSITGVGTFVDEGNPPQDSASNPTSDPGASYPTGHGAEMTEVYRIIKEKFAPNMAADMNSGTTSGTSSPSAPTRIYAIAFGDLFDTTLAVTPFQRQNAQRFLLTVQKYGGTSKWSDTALPPEQIITGDFTTRIENLRTSLQRILQSGVQVTLIE